MTSMTLALPDDLAQRLRPLEPYLSIVLELSLVGFQTAAAATATEVIRFLSGDPSPKEILAYHASERTQDGPVVCWRSIRRVCCRRMSNVSWTSSRKSSIS